MDEMFRVGDIVRAVVISLGDQSFYYCSTARNELGVVMGRSEEGNVLVPVSWREMVDGRSGRREGRKVARPVLGGGWAIGWAMGINWSGYPPA
ncbi:hypothetical protein EMPG_13225 [Blastomyces silverae]|uniref:Exosome complex component CSL4 C-terminal domain-containing protein n=1 Tax=Blastomyces silverae TaxID=2060906 RepID=A0A0H1BJ94_9EURO|nr:hypothetical protein EMPG_13225 [Blastomyces silverae]